MAVGPGAIIESGEAPKPLLEGATEMQVVTVYNPLPVPFTGQVGQSKAVSMPFQIRTDGTTQVVSRTEDAVKMNYGLNLKNPDHQARLPIVNRITIESGKTLNILGNEAQVVVRQLVNEIMQREGKRLLLADAFARREVEQRVVRDIRGINEALDMPQSVQSQLRDSIAKLNEADNEQEFPGLNQSVEGSSEGSGDLGNEAESRKGGAPATKPRVAKAQG